MNLTETQKTRNFLQKLQKAMKEQGLNNTSFLEKEEERLTNNLQEEVLTLKFK